MLPPAEWTAHRLRITTEHAAGWITRAQRDVLYVIADLNAAGIADPTVAHIAVNAHCHPATVRRARAKGQERGLLGVEARYEVVDGRRQQRSNTYHLHVPSEPCWPKPRGAHRAGPITEVRKQEALRAMMEGAKANPSALNDRASVIQARLAADYRQRRLL